MSESTTAPTRELDRWQSMRLLSGCRYGRVVLTEHALPSVVTVAFRVDDEGVVVGDNGDGRLAGLAEGSVVAFEADHADTGDGSGWSVVVTGYASTVTDEAGSSGVGASGRPRRPAPAGRLVRISPTIVAGRTFTLPG